MAIEIPNIIDHLSSYTQRIREIRSDPGHHPETSLYSPFEQLLDSLAHEIGCEIQIIQQYREEGIGAPDYGIRTRNGGLHFIEAKDPTTNLGRLRGRDREQFQNYLNFENLIYTNFWELRLYQSGEFVRQVELVPETWIDPSTRTRQEILETQLRESLELIIRFLDHEPAPIRSPIDLATKLASGAILVREAVRQVIQLAPEDSPPMQIYNEFRNILFYDLEEDEFADSYAQTLSYGLLLARQSTAQALTPHTVAGFVDSSTHQLLSATLNLFCQDPVVSMIGWAVQNLVNTVNGTGSGHR